MSKLFTYSGDPAESDVSEVRFLIGDTVRSRCMFDDKEIAFQLTQTPNKKLAGADLLENKAREFARQADVKVGDVSKAFSKVSDALLKTAANLRCDANKRALPFFGGLTRSGKRTLAADIDDVQPSFGIGITDNPGAVQLNGAVITLVDLVGPGVL